MPESRIFPGWCQQPPHRSLCFCPTRHPAALSLHLPFSSQRSPVKTVTQIMSVFGSDPSRGPAMADKDLHAGVPPAFSLYSSHTSFLAVPKTCQAHFSLRAFALALPLLGKLLPPVCPRSSFMSLLNWNPLSEANSNSPIWISNSIDLNLQFSTRHPVLLRLLP